VLVAGEDTRGLAVVAVEPVEHGEDEVAVIRVAGPAVAHPAELQRHAVVHAVVVQAEPGRLRAVGLEVLEVAPPVVRLVQDLVDQVEDGRVARLLVEPVEADDEVGGAEAGPTVERGRGDDGVDLPGAPEHRRHDTRVSGGLLILRQRLEEDEQRPDVVGLVVRVVVTHRAHPAVGRLVVEDVVEIPFDLGLERVIVEQVGQGHGAVEPVGRALPALGLAADPGTVLDVGPELVQVPAESLGLGRQLRLQPSSRPDGPQRKLGVSRCLQFRGRVPRRRHVRGAGGERG